MSMHHLRSARPGESKVFRGFNFKKGEGRIQKDLESAGTTEYREN